MRKTTKLPTTNYLFFRLFDTKAVFGSFKSFLMIKTTGQNYREVILVVFAGDFSKTFYYKGASGSQNPVCSNLEKLPNYRLMKN